MAIKRITLNQLLDDKENDWALLYSSNTWSYYVNYKNGDWTKTVRIKKSIVNRYLDGELERKPANWEYMKEYRKVWNELWGD